MVILKIKENSNQAKAVLEMLKTFSFVEVINTTGLGKTAVTTPKVSKNQPNALTLKTMKETQEGKNLTKTTSHKDLMNKLFA